MKKILALILALSLLFTLCACGGEKETTKDDGGKSDKEAFEGIIRYETAKIDGHEIDNIKYKYDKYGNVIEEKETYDDGEVYVCTYKYEYDENGNIIVKERYYDGNLRSRTEYNEKGLITLLRSYVDGESEHIYEYDENGRMTKQVYTSEYDSGYEYVYEYTDYDNGTSNFFAFKMIVGNQGELIGRGKYDEENRLVSEEYNMDDEYNRYKNTYSYGVHGDVVKKTEENYYGTTNTYYENGLVIEIEYYGSDGLDSREEYEYDEYGNLLKETSFHASGDVISEIKYTYSDPVEINIKK